MTTSAPTTPPVSWSEHQGDLVSQRNVYSIVGALVLRWARIEQQILSSIQQMEMSLATPAGIWPPHYTDLSQSSFRRRKGRLRELICEHGTKQELNEFDKILKRIAKVQDIRHACAHGIVTLISGPAGKDPVAHILNYGNLNLRKRFASEWMPLAELDEAAAELWDIPRAILELTSEISLCIRGRPVQP